MSGRHVQTQPRLPDPRMIPLWEAPRRDGGIRYTPGAAPLPVRPEDGPVVRPFLLTGGRTRPLRDGLRIETMVSARPAALSAPLRFEARHIVEICQRPMAVVDVAVAIRVPLGVAKVLVADLATEGHLRCEEQDELPIALIERIRDRVRAL